MKTGQYHVLVVDDEEMIRQILQQGISRAGYRCSTAADGLAALDVLDEDPADVVITDITMPNLDGIELTKRVKTEYDADIVVMTGFTEETAYEDIISMGASDFIYKPVGVREMIIRLERVLRERAVSLQRMRAEEELKQSLGKLTRIMDQTVNALASALEKRDPYTAGHHQKVSSLAYEIAKLMDLPQYQVEGIRIAGILHDIGKISVPTDILTKPGRLSINEFNLIKEHPQVGFDILQGIEFERPIAECIIQHHERLNGSGYPRGLSGTEIIMEARILAVTDVVEAMASHRPYRPSLGIQKALEEISKNSGELYDPIVVEAFLTFFKKNVFQF